MVYEIRAICTGLSADVRTSCAVACRGVKYPSKIVGYLRRYRRIDDMPPGPGPPFQLPVLC